MSCIYNILHRNRHDYILHYFDSMLFSFVLSLQPTSLQEQKDFISMCHKKLVDGGDVSEGEKRTCGTTGFRWTTAGRTSPVIRTMAGRTSPVTLY